MLEDSPSAHVDEVSSALDTGHSNGVWLVGSRTAIGAHTVI